MRLLKMSLDFKFNYYYHKYKDKALPNSDEFRRRFRKSEGNFEYLNELIFKIINYQVKTYGATLSGGEIIRRRRVNHGEYQKGKKTWFV